jgi:hypothetical protein
LAAEAPLVAIIVETVGVTAAAATAWFVSDELTVFLSCACVFHGFSVHQK